MQGALHHRHRTVDEAATPAAGKDAAQVLERVEIGGHASAGVDPVEQSGELKGAAFARRTLTARPLGEEAHILRDLADDARAFRKHDHRAGAETRTTLPYRVEIERNVEVTLRQQGVRGATREHRLELLAL